MERANHTRDSLDRHAPVWFAGLAKTELISNTVKDFQKPINGYQAHGGYQ
jgi:hypothetical protein